MKRIIRTLLLICLLFTCLSAEAFADDALSTLKFTTLTIEDQEITSEELFQGHPITVVNIWATWCKPCIEELEALSELHARLQKLDCGVVGILYDGDMSQEEGLAIANEKGVNYPVLLPCDDMKILAGLTVFPTTFFVDSESHLVGEVVTGAKVEEYDRVVQSFLNTKGAASSPTAEETGTTDSKNNGTQYSTETAAAPAAAAEPSSSAPEGMVWVCDGDSCTLVPAETSENAAPHPADSTTPDPVETGENGNTTDVTQDSEQGTQAVLAEGYPICSISVEYISDTEIIATATDEYFTLGGNGVPLP